jgi:hypothetical protein
MNRWLVIALLLVFYSTTPGGDRVGMTCSCAAVLVRVVAFG